MSQVEYVFSHDSARDLRGRLSLVFLEYLAAGFFSDCVYSSLDIILQQNSFGLGNHSFYWLQIRSEVLIEQADQRRS